MAKGDLTLSYFGRSYTFTFSGSAITPSSQVFAVDDYVTFTTTGTLPSGIALNTVYRVVSASTTIAVSATEGGTPISLSGGSGTHSIRISSIIIFRRFINDKPPRETSRLSGNGTFTASGNFLVSGISFEDPQQYSIQAKVSVEDVMALQMMYATTDKFRREASSPFLTLTDEITLFPEEGKTAITKTRSSVGTPIQKYGGVFYYPVLQVFMPSAPDIGIDRGVDAVTVIVDLQETGVKL